MNNKLALAAASAMAITLLLAGCSADTSSTSTDGGGGGDAASCTNKITKTDLPTVSVWGWYPNMDKVVDNFNAGSDEVQACWTNVGQGNDEYDKFQTAISAGTGAPDVIMLEADRIPNYVVQNALVDISDFGVADVKDNFSAGAWKDVSVGDAVYGAPVDGGPMGMIYRTDVFEQYGITPPTTWAEYEAAAQKVKDAGGPLFGDVGANVPAVFMALTIQNGATPFTYDPATPEEIGIKVNDDASKEVLDYWAGLVKKGLVGTQDQFTPEYISGVVGGDYATYVSAAWAPGYLTGAGVGEGDDAGKFAVAPLPAVGHREPRLGQLGRLRLLGDEPVEAAGARREGRARHLRRRRFARRWLAEPDHLPAQQQRPHVGRVRERGGRVLQRTAGEQGGVRPRGGRLRGLHLQPVRLVLLRLVHRGARRDQQR